MVRVSVLQCPIVRQAGVTQEKPMSQLNEQKFPRVFSFDEGGWGGFAPSRRPFLSLIIYQKYKLSAKKMKRKTIS